MGQTSASPSIKVAGGAGRLGRAHLLLALPCFGLLGLLWVASHRITKPEISIFQAIEEGDMGAVRAHLQTGTSINSVNPQGHSPLFMAIYDKKPRIVQFL